MSGPAPFTIKGVQNVRERHAPTPGVRGQTWCRECTVDPYPVDYPCDAVMLAEMLLPFLQQTESR